MRACRAFTLIEIAISVFILTLLMLLAVPSLNGVLADRRLHRTYDEFNRLVQQAQQLSTEERRPYLIVWRRGSIILQPEAFAKGEEKKPTAVLTGRPQCVRFDTSRSADKKTASGMDLLAIGKLRARNRWIQRPRWNVDR